MVRDLNLDIATHTTVFVAATAYSANTAAINLGLSPPPLDPSLQLQVWVTDPAAVRPIEVELQVSTDGGTLFFGIGKVRIPGNKTGVFTANVGRELKAAGGGVTDVRLRANVSAAADASVENAVLQIGVGLGERSFPQQ